MFLKERFWHGNRAQPVYFPLSCTMYATVVVADSKMGHGCNAYSPGKTDAVDSKIGSCCGDPQAGLLLLICWIIHRRTIFMENRVEGKCKRRFTGEQ
jgi:hypothetical protein